MSGWATGSMERVEAGEEADPGLNNVDDRNTPIEAHCSTGSSPSSPSQGHAAMTNQCKVTADDSKSTTSATSTCSLSPPTSGSSNVDLTICSKVQFQLRDGVPGVSYQDTENTAGWAPVIGRRRKEPQLPPCVLRRFPPDGDGTSQTVTLKRMKKSAFHRMQMRMCALTSWMDAWPASHG